MIYVLCTPANKLDKRGRVSGWHFVPLERKAKQEWRALLAPLKGRPINGVVASDLDMEAANVAGNELGIPVRTDYLYRRFNFGRFHARDAVVADGAIRAVEEKWKSNADVPIREGDSLTSFKKRFVANFEKLLAKEGDCLFLTDARSIAVIRDGFDPHALIPNGNPVKRDKIFMVKRKEQ
jgi:broad specificity phosphatase PhoE